MFILDRDERKMIQSGNRLNRYPPIGAILNNGRRDRAMVIGLHRITARFRTGQQAFDQYPRPTPLIAIDHHDRRIPVRFGNNLVWCSSFESLIPSPENNSL